MVRILIISDDHARADEMRELLSAQGFDVEAANGFGEGDGLHRAAEAPGILVLDQGHSPEAAYATLRKVRASSGIPVLMMLDADGPEERIECLEAGADDCLGRPYHPRELTARVRSLLRRQVLRSDSMSPIEANGVRLVPASREVLCDGRAVSTTTVEFDILSVLMRSAGAPVSRDQLMESLYHRKATAFDRSIDMHVSHLRRKLSSERTLIKTVRGAGYQFCLPGEPAD